MYLVSSSQLQQKGKAVIQVVGILNDSSNLYLTVPGVKYPSSRVEHHLMYGQPNIQYHSLQGLSVLLNAVSISDHDVTHHDSLDAGVEIP